MAVALIAFVTSRTPDEGSDPQLGRDQVAVGGAIADADASAVAVAAADAAARPIDAREAVQAVEIEIRITTEPVGAEIAVDGVVKGVSPLIVKVASASTSAVISATLPGYERAEQNVGINTGSVSISLRPLKHSAGSAVSETSRSRPTQRPRNSEQSSLLLSRRPTIPTTSAVTDFRPLPVLLIARVLFDERSWSDEPFRFASSSDESRVAP